MQAGHPCSWQAIATAVRRHAATLSGEARMELEQFAELLDGIAKLNKADVVRNGSKADAQKGNRTLGNGEKNVA